MTGPSWCHVREAAEALGLPVWRVLRLVDAGKLAQHIGLGGARMVDADQVGELVHLLQVLGVAELAAENRELHALVREKGR